MLGAALVLAAPAWVFSWIASVDGQVLGVAIADTIAYAWLLMVRFVPGVRPRVKAVSLVMVLHLVGLSLLFALGPLGHGVMWLMGATVSAAALLPRGGARIAFGAHVVSVVGASIAFALVPERFFQLPLKVEGWYAFAAGSLLLGGALSAAIGSLIGGAAEAVSELSAERTRLQAETARRARLEADLDRRVTSRTAELATANADLERFARTVSHDLRSSLQVINGSAELVQLVYAELVPPEGQSHLARIRNGVRRAEALIKALLVLAQVGRAPLVRGRVDITSLTHALLDDLLAANPERGVHVDIQVGLVANADPDLVRVLLENLLSNAWKFTSKQATARIEVGAHAEGGYFVKDDGIGFDDALAKQIFQEFARLHAQSDFPGTGIGLATVSRVVARHGGHVWATAAPGAGATFRFTLDEGAESST